jgi:hypothetical protein
MSGWHETAARRMYDRFEANVSAMVRRGSEAAETVLMENISARGAAVLGYRPLAVNDKLSILFRLPFVSKRTIHKQAHVAWCTQIKEGVWEAGLDFGLDNMLLLH